MDARCVNKDNLPRRSALAALHVDIALDAMPRRLRLMSDNGDFLANERVQQRGLARVGPTDDGDKT